jgi:Domain of unknown function(DUF2779)
VAWLTKSRFLSGLQCPKRLWFEIHQPLTEPQPESVAFFQGRAVDALARELQPGLHITRERGMSASISETTRVMTGDAPDVLHQAAFRRGDLAAVVDVLRRHGSAFDLVEVKAATSVKPEHIADAAFQTLVLRAAQVPVGAVLLSHVDSGFVLREAGQYAGLLLEEDITAAVEDSLDEVAARAHGLQQVMAASRQPAIAMGPQCHAPYECPFIPRCTVAAGPVPEYPVSLLPRGAKQAEQLMNEGLADLRDVPAERLSAELHRRVHAATVSGEPYFDAAATAALRELPYPRAYLDFETIGFAVPQIIGSGPYWQFPFQWSVQVEQADGSVREAEYLAIESFGDFAALAVPMLAAIPAQAPVLAYNASFEARVLLDLAKRLPQYAEQLKSVAERLFDLLPVTRQAYYHRDMRGSWSIKSVVPTIRPDLSYQHLSEVRDGDGAQLAFLQLRDPNVKGARRDALTQALLGYCRQDTWAMVELARFLSGRPVAQH